MAKAAKAATKAPAAKRAAKPTGAPDRGVSDPAPAQPEVQAKVDAEQERGLRGVEVDETPNENYTVAGVTAGKPTPETSREAGTRVPVQHLRDGKIEPR